MFVVDKLLIVDVGNTSIKYTAFEGDVIQWQLRDYERLNKLHFFPDAIYFASVRSQEASLVLQQEMKKDYPDSKFILLESSAEACGVVCAYDEPWCLGIDRWLTVVASFHLYGGNVAIVDAGTAIKVDFVNQSAHHLGGYIVPGLVMMENALLSNTARIRLDSSVEVKDEGLPNSTARAISEGCHEMISGFLERVHANYPDFRWIMTGGDGQFLLDTLDIDAEYKPHLVAFGARLVGNEFLKSEL